MLILGGLDTTANVLGSGTHYLATHPADRKRLRELSVPRRSAVEELLRLFAPTVFLGRTAAGPHCLGGREIAAGDFVTVSYASANRDDQEFAEPTEFRPEREPNRHLAFGLGPHRCLGAHLARLVIDVALDRILERLQDLRLAAGQKAFFHTSVTHGAVRLPIEFTPGRRLQPAY
jgi:cytochrome P450